MALKPKELRAGQRHTKRKPHQKSRNGCGNCKLRGVKCDETRPICERCRRAHVGCSYKNHATEMESCHEISMNITKVVKPRCSTNETILAMINGILSHHESNKLIPGHTFQLKLQDLELLSRFQHGNVLSCGPKNHMEIYKTQTIRLSALNPYLLHVVMTCTAMHGRYLAGKSHTKRSPFEAYHWAMASQLFNHEISVNAKTYDADALWMAAAIMSWIVLYAVETPNPEEVWPLSSTASSNIPWFPIQKGLRVIWDMVQKSIFSRSAIASSERCLGLAPPEPGIKDIPQDLVEMCELDESSNAITNPYHTAVRRLSSLLGNSGGVPNSLRFLGFVNTTEPEFEVLLQQRDPRALLLMALWYEFVPETAWWMTFRASLERKAICIYLDRFHANDPHIGAVLASLQTAQHITPMTACANFS